MQSHLRSNASFNVTMNCKISLRSWGWMNCLTKKRPWLLVLAGSNSSCHKTSTLPNNLPVNLVHTYPVAETVRGFKEILDGKYDHLPEDAFRGVGSIEDVIAKAEKMGF